MNQLNVVVLFQSNLTLQIQLFIDTSHLSSNIRGFINDIKVLREGVNGFVTAASKHHVSLKAVMPVIFVVKYK